VYVLKHKYQTLEAFKEFHAKVERETGRKLKCVRSKNDGEYRGPFKRYCRQFGIGLEKSPPNTPRLNGLAERMNRTLTERVIAMLSHAHLPNSFLAEALMNAMYVVNLSPSVPLVDDISQGVWSGKEVSYKHLKVFGCRAFVHVPMDERSKLDSKKKQCIYLSQPSEEFGYSLWDPANRKIVLSQDVVFIEDETIKDNGNQRSQ
jgi:hypothetical protein